MAIQKVLVTKDYRVTIVCKSCGRDSNLSVSRYMGNKSAVQFNAKCRCGYAFKVRLERRQWYRKETNFVGEAYYRNEPAKRFDIRIIDLSESGLKFTSPFGAPFEEDDKLIVEFQLDDKDYTLVKKTVVVRNIRADTAGVEFTETSEFDKIARYMRFG